MVEYTAKGNSYIDELITSTLFKIHSIRGRIEQIVINRFPSDNPKRLIELFSIISKELETYLYSLQQDKDNTPSKIEREVKFTALFLCEIASHLRFVEGAIFEKTPWSLVRPFEKFTQEIHNDALVILRPQWVYNYSIISELLTYYEKKLNFIGKDKLNLLFRDCKKVYIISFPGFERKNILLHANFGHEIGHPIADIFLEKEQKDYLLEIGKKVEETFRNKYANDTLLSLLNWTREKKNLIDTIVQIRNRGLQEIIADLAGVKIFGLAAILSLDEVAQIFQSFDDVSSQDYYPPWRMRIRILLKYLEDNSIRIILSDLEKSIKGKIIYEQIISSLKNKIDYFITLTSKTDDKDNINRDDMMKIAYDSIDKALIEANKFLNSYFSTKPFCLNKNKIEKEMLPLCERLYYNIPPNAIENFEDDPFNKNYPDISTIINAGWFYKTAYLPSLFTEEKSEVYFNKLDTINRLILKAIELSYIGINYKVWEMKK